MKKEKKWYKITEFSRENKEGVNLITSIPFEQQCSIKMLDGNDVIIVQLPNKDMSEMIMNNTIENFMEGTRTAFVGAGIDKPIVFIEDKVKFMKLIEASKNESKILEANHQRQLNEQRKRIESAIEKEKKEEKNKTLH